VVVDDQVALVALALAASNSKGEARVKLRTPYEPEFTLEGKPGEETILHPTNKAALSLANISYLCLGSRTARELDIRTDTHSRRFAAEGN